MKTLVSTTLYDPRGKYESMEVWGPGPTHLCDTRIAPNNLVWTSTLIADSILLYQSCLSLRKIQTVHLWTADGEAANVPGYGWLMKTWDTLCIRCVHESLDTPPKHHWSYSVLPARGGPGPHCVSCWCRQSAQMVEQSSSVNSGAEFDQSC